MIWIEVSRSCWLSPWINHHTLLLYQLVPSNLPAEAQLVKGHQKGFVWLLRPDAVLIRGLVFTHVIGK